MKVSLSVENWKYCAVINPGHLHQICKKVACIVHFLGTHILDAKQKHIAC